jgi:hypothetical protein
MFKEKYGLRLYSLYDRFEYETKEILINNGGELRGELKITKNGIFKISTKTDLQIRHNPQLQFLHIYLDLLSDNIKASISTYGFCDSSKSDIYYHVINHGDNNRFNIDMNLLIGEGSDLIYRSRISNLNNSASIFTANSQVEILNIGNKNKIAVEPAVQVEGYMSSMNHSLLMSYISTEHYEFYALYGFDIQSTQELIKDDYIKINN